MKKKQKIVLIVLVAVVVILIFCYLLLPKFSKDNVGIYYKKSDGTYATNEWVKRFFDWYYFDGNGYMVKGQITPDEYYTDYKTGKLMKNYWLSVNGKYYYFDENGKFTRDRWIEYKNNYFYITPAGDMATNRWINNEFYVGQDGAMLTNTTTPDGNSVGSDGKALYKVNNENNNYANKNSKLSSNDLYNEIISNIPDDKNTYDMVDYQPNGVLSFWGYQILDVNGDGIDELFIYRNGYLGRFFIDEAYTIKNNKVVIFDVGVGTDGVRTKCYTGATRDNIWYALKDGMMVYYSYHWGSLDEITIINPKTDKKDYIYYDVTQSSSGWIKNGEEISIEELEEEKSTIESKIGYFQGSEVRNK